MRQRRTLALSLLVLLLVPSGFQAASLQPEADEPESRVPLPQENPLPTVTLRAASGKTIGFVVQNGRTTHDSSPQVLELPHLVLYRNGALTPPAERTLILTVSDVVLPPSGVTVALTVQTYHGDPDRGDALDSRITVWRESKWLRDPPALDRLAGTLVFEHEFGATVIPETESVATPTDYFRLELEIFNGSPTALVPAYTFRQDHAFLMENQASAPLNLDQTVSGGAVPEELVVYYCDMFAFQHDIIDPASRLRREEIPRYVQKELVSALLEAIRVQTEDWGFPWQQAWTSYRAGDGKERLSVALSDGETWFHGQAPVGGHSGVSLQTKGGANRYYETLTDGLLSAFHHELFHNLQKGMAQDLAGHGDVDGRRESWGFFSEGTAVLAESVAQPAKQFMQTSGPRSYTSHANGFLTATSGHGELNTSYAEMRPYSAAIYWRFLYEQCGGMSNKREDPAAGMRISRRSLEVLYSGMLVDISQSTDLVRYLPIVMDQVLAGPKAPSCPFQTYRESLQRFARAIYQLRLAGGRCTAPGVPAGCGFYDPSNLYDNPPVSTVTYRGEQIVFAAAEGPYPNGIKSSFGIDLVDVVLDPGTQGHPLTIEFSTAPEGDAEFSVQIWKLMDTGVRAGPQKRPVPVAAPEQIAERTADGHLLYAIPDIDTGETNRLGLIITRLDSEEDSDPVGAYTLVLQPGHGL